MEGRTRPVYVNTDASLKGWGGILLQHFTFETIHVAGEINVEADTLSRILSFDKSSD